MPPTTTASSAESPPVPRVDVERLALLLDGDHHELRQRIRAILAGPAFTPRTGLGREEHRALVFRQLRALAREGLGFVGYPVEVGGGGAGDVAGGVAVFEQLAVGDLSLLVKFGVQFGLFGGTIVQLGTAEHHRAHLRDAATVKLPGCFAMTETGHGSNVRDLRTTARYDTARAQFVIDTPDDGARKDYIGNAALHGRMAVVFAQLEVDGERHGVHAFLVPVRDARGRARRGVRIADCGEKLGLNGVDNGRLWFRGVRVPRAALLNRFADVAEDGTYSSPIGDPSKRFFTMLAALVQGRVSIATAAVSASKVALAIAVRYGERRRQFGPPGGEEVAVLDYLTHQRRLMPALATTYALDFAAKHLVAEYARSVGGRAGSKRRREVEGLAAGIKAVATWHATETIQTCREACGGAGYLAENRLAALRADTDVFTTFEGDNTVLLQLVAKGLLTGYRQEFGDLDLIGMVRLVAGRVIGTIAETVPAGFVPDVVGLVTGRDGADDDAVLRRRDFQLGAMRFRERHLLAGLGRRVKGAVDRGADPFAAVLAVQDHMVATAAAHVERVVLERFDAAVRRAGARLGATLDPLCSLYALHRIERDRGWFLEHGHLSPGRSKALLRTVNALCGEVRQVAGDLVDAFAIPDAVLAAPIATG